ncbi:unnamed protein product [Rotaria magnacalcarata]|uniref:Fork-head domain-containing protein n=1 Tax=Rotaria magnacalcarata TaxID=392030 RepID=A0A815XL19_9BILA|nr:unnamed protein product [Rotaria magnacalcarata]CAF1559259.1 unnamed protein product [Rotaria magnacalcarata]CAF2044216.1 unnamed protein product [Rotaria magnacalcarata]CAF2103612.1 unnamed protein product [Rotaria magnacalcarata]CAF3810965.1 unnamed protein product [Rotaria magnacalcarata]
MQSMPNNLYYQPNSEYEQIMNKYPFHDSGIADEGLSDETGSIEEEYRKQENDKDDNEIPKKPNPSYLEIIAEAILKAPNRMMQLYEIYNYFQRKYRYFAEDVNKSWKNSVRHNLSLNDCFVKAGRGSNGKGHFWRIHHLAEPEFEQGRFRRRRYRQEMRRLNMQASSMHESSYVHQSVSPFYSPSTNPYYMCSSAPPPYHATYSTLNTSTETHAISPPALQNGCLSSSTPSPYPFYDQYSAHYYPTHYNSMASSYASPNESMNFDA